MKVAYLLNSSSGYSLYSDDEYPACSGDSVFLEAGIMVEIIKQACGRSLVKVFDPQGHGLSNDDDFFCWQNDFDLQQVVPYQKP